MPFWTDGKDLTKEGKWVIMNSDFRKDACRKFEERT